MASTYSPNLRLELIGTGEQQGTWGITTNTNLGTLLEEAIGGYTSVTVADAGDTTLTTNNGSADQSRNMTINLTGALTGARNVICPAIEKVYIVKNSTTGGQAVTFKVSGQTGVSIPNGSTYILYVNGTDAVLATGTIAAQNANNVSITGGSITGITDLAVADGGTGASTAAGAATNLGLGTGDSPQFAGVNIGNATDTTITRSSAGVIAVEGKPVVMTTGAQTVEFAAGSNTAPSITTTGDTNTGIFFPAADTIAFAEGGAEAMRIDSSGNVGIGTSSPSYKLSVNSSNGINSYDGVSGKGRFVLGDPADPSGYVGMYRSAAATIGTAGNDLTIGSYNDIAFTTGAAAFSSQTERMRINLSGNVGIGTASPSYKLDIGNGPSAGTGGNVLRISGGSTNAADGASIFFKTGTSTNSAIGNLSGITGGAFSDLFCLYANSGAVFYTGGLNERMRIDSSGNVGIGTSSPSYKLDVSGSAYAANWYTPSTAFTVGTVGGGTAIIGYGSTGSGGTTNTLVFSAGSERMRIDSSGNVGIGTSSPGAKLDVNGAISVSGDGSDVAIYMNGSDAIRNTGTGSIMYLDVAAGSSTQGQFVFRSSNAYTERMRIDSNGNVGIGTSSPAVPLDVQCDAAAFGIRLRGRSADGISLLRFVSNDGATTYSQFDMRPSYSAINNVANIPMLFYTNNTERMQIGANGNVGIGTSAPATLCHINGTIRYTNRPAAGTITAIGYDTNGDLKNSSSSLRYKHDINDYDKGLDTVLQLRPVTFKFNGETRENSGFIAEEVDALGLNEVMLYDEENRPDGVLYSNMVALLTKAIQEQQVIISDLQARISTLENN